ncbi:MAG: BtpA/SgcQ family protein [Actinomycetota bacterium]
MVHLPPLPGSPRYRGDLDGVIERAREDALTLKQAGFPSLMIENFGDLPFYGDRVPAETVASMTRVIAEISTSVALPFGVNVLRNDANAALAIAVATGAAFIRVNVLSGMMITDQGPIVGQAADIARQRRRLCPDVTILADVFVKHATPPPGLSIEQAALDTWERGGAGALIVSGEGTGGAPDPDDLKRVRSAVPEAPLLVGSGANPESLEQLAMLADGAIVGSFLMSDGKAGNPVDRRRAADFVAAAARVGWT